MRKPRVLWISEATFMSTGFSTIANGMLERLHATDKFLLAEFGSYSKTSDPRAANLPWKFYGAIPESDDAFGNKRYDNSYQGQFGQAMYEQVCLDFRPDFCVHDRDPWFIDWSFKSPFAKYVKTVVMPTIDGAPQKVEWIDDYEKIDRLITLSRYGKEVLQKEAPHIKIFDVGRPGVDHNVFKPLDKKALREFFGIDPNCKIISTVMRNQKRKLFPDLFDAFREYIDLCLRKNNEFFAKNTYLYLHTSYPDVGFDIGKLIKHSGLGHKILMTYCCAKCGAYYPDFFQSELSTCKRCGNLSCHMPNTQKGLTREDLVKIYNLGDIYIQYATTEGFGLGICEAKSCGIPALAVDYSAMSEQVEIEGCAKIEVEKFFYESVIETEQIRALPSNSDAAKKMYKLLSVNEETYKRYSENCREDVLKNYTYDRAAKIFEKALDSLPIIDHKETWDNPVANIPPMNYECLQQFNHLGNAEFLDLAICNILGKPELCKGYWRNSLLKSLNVGFNISRGGRDIMDRNNLVGLLMNMAQEIKFWEMKRTEKFKSKEEVNFATI